MWDKPQLTSYKFIRILQTRQPVKPKNDIGRELLVKLSYRSGSVTPSEKELLFVHFKPNILDSDGLFRYRSDHLSGILLDKKTRMFGETCEKDRDRDDEYYRKRLYQTIPLSDIYVFPAKEMDCMECAAKYPKRKICLLNNGTNMCCDTEDTRPECSGECSLPFDKAPGLSYYGLC